MHGAVEEAAFVQVPPDVEDADYAESLAENEPHSPPCLKFEPDEGAVHHNPRGLCRIDPRHGQALLLAVAQSPVPPFVLVEKRLEMFKSYRGQGVRDRSGAARFG